MTGKDFWAEQFASHTTLATVSTDLDNWLDKYGRYLPAEAKQALIPIRDFLSEYTPTYRKYFQGN